MAPPCDFSAATVPVLLIRVRPGASRCGGCLSEIQGAHEFVSAWMLDGSILDAASWRIIKHVCVVTGELSLL